MKGEAPKGAWRPEHVRMPDAPEPMVAIAKPKSKTAKPFREPIKQRKIVEPQSGTLTAGSFDDNFDSKSFRSFVNKIAQKATIGDFAGKLAGHKLIVTVKDRDGKPVGNARVRIRSAQSERTEFFRTRSDGRVILITDYDNMPDENLLVTVSPPDGSQSITESVPRGKTEWDITLSDTQASLPQILDLAIVLDTTGSMGDEMRYLKSELRNITAEIGNRFPQVRQRYALIVYRDQGDTYVSRRFPFTESLDEFRKTLNEQHAGGGGDFPEAVHKGLEDAARLSWSEDNAARVLFLVADAPPHRELAPRALKAVDALRKSGVAIYPVAGSGAESSYEFFMRTSAMLTGGQYLFLTDDSGVGNAHAEPAVRGYHVQRLDHLMIRMIAGELLGRRLAPRPERIIRTVGQRMQ